MNEIRQRLDQWLELLIKQRKEHTESRWIDAIQFVIPMLAEFPGISLTDKRYDSRASVDSEMLADAMVGSMAPATIDWFKYRFEENELNDDKRAITWLQEVEERMYEVFARSTFYDVQPTLLRYGNTIETATLFIERDNVEGRIVCMVPHPLEIYLATDRFGNVNHLFRKYRMTAEQIVDQFGDSAPSAVVRDAAKTAPYELFDIVHAIVPRTRRDVRKPDALNMPWASYFWEVNAEGGGLLHEGGFKTFPAPTWRWEVRGTEPYGYGPTSDAMPDIRTVNQIVRTMLMTAQRAGDPPIFGPAEQRNWNYAPGARNYYTDPARRPFIIDTGAAGYPFNADMLEKLHQRIDDIYKVKHFLMLMQQEGQMTAREVVERKAEKVTVAGSIVGKYSTEMLDRVHARFLQLEMDAGTLPQPPNHVTGAHLKIDYQGPMAQAQRELHAVQGIINTLTYAMPIFQLWPRTLKRVKPELMLDEILRARGVPEKAITSDKEYKQLLEQEAQAAAAQQQAAAMAEAGKAIDLGAAPEPGSPLAQMMGGTE